MASQGNFEEAGPLYKRSLDIDERVYGPDHPEVATDLHNLALLVQDQVRVIRRFLETCVVSTRNVYLECSSEQSGRSWEVGVGNPGLRLTCGGSPNNQAGSMNDQART